MDPTYENKRRRLESGYWLFRARRELIFTLLSRSGIHPDSKILDAGCGGGLLIKFLRQKRFKNIFGIDTSKVMVTLCRDRGLVSISRQDCARTAFAEELFDVIIAADALEHLEYDVNALREWKRILRKDGKLIITVPAFKFLWSHHDEICHHYRRYSRSDLLRALSAADFHVERLSFWNLFLFFPLCIRKMLKKILAGDGSNQGDQLYELNPIVNNLLLRLLRFENRILSWISFPVGISICVVARKMNSDS